MRERVGHPRRSEPTVLDAAPLPGLINRADRPAGTTILLSSDALPNRATTKIEVRRAHEPLGEAADHQEHRADRVEFFSCIPSRNVVNASTVWLTWPIDLTHPVSIPPVHSGPDRDRPRISSIPRCELRRFRRSIRS